MSVSYVTQEQELKAWWFALEVGAACSGLLVAVLLVTEVDPQWLKMMIYAVATIFSIHAGGLLKRLNGSVEDVARRNDRYHKWSVLILNGSVGLGCAVYLWKHLAQAMLPGWILGSFFMLYIASWAFKIIRPHSLWARYRSVLSRVVLTTVIVGIMWKHGYWLVPFGSVPFLVMSWRHLRRDQVKFDWPDR